MKLKALVAISVFSLAFVRADRVQTRFHAPPGHRIVTAQAGSFGNWLGNLPLKPVGTHTQTYNGDIARTDAYTAAVVDISVGSNGLQQCADAVMRLRAEYLYQLKQYNLISFNFTNGFRCDFAHYANGYRFQGNGWVLKGKKDFSYENFLRYLNLVFSYAGTISLEKELVKPNSGIIQAGDVFIHGGSPGHCFIVLKVCADNRGRQSFLLAQSFIPAQNIQILQAGDNPWFSLSQIANIPYGNLVAESFRKRFKN